MKKFTLIIIASFCFVSTINAQINKGSLFLGGSFGGSSSSSKDDAVPNYESKSSGFSIYPQIGKAIGTNKILGITLGYGQNTTESNFNGTEDKNTTYSAGVFYRRYYPLSSRFFLFGQADLGWSQRQEKREYNSMIFPGSSTTNGINLNVTPGISFAATRKLHLEASLNSLFGLGYQSGKSKSYNNTGTLVSSASQKSFAFSGNGNGFSNITIGLRWILPKKNG